MASDSEASITVPRWKDVSSLDGKWKKYYTVYMVRFQAGEIDQVVFKRYKQFQKLDTKCRARFAPDYGAKLPKLPPKSGFFSSTDTEDKKNDRRRGLQSYLQVVAAERDLVDLIADFVDVAVAPQREGQPPPRKGAQKWGTLWVFEKPLMVYGPGTNNNGSVHIGDLLIPSSFPGSVYTTSDRDSDDDNYDNGELNYRAASLSTEGTGYDAPYDQTAKAERETWEFMNFESKLARSGSSMRAAFRMLERRSGSLPLPSSDLSNSNNGGNNSSPSNTGFRSSDEHLPVRQTRSVTFYHSVLVFGSKPSHKRPSKPVLPPASSSLSSSSSSSFIQANLATTNGIPVGTLVVAGPGVSLMDGGIPTAIPTGIPTANAPVITAGIANNSTATTAGGTSIPQGTVPPEKNSQARPALVITDDYFDNPRKIGSLSPPLSSSSLASTSPSTSSSSSSSISPSTKQQSPNSSSNTSNNRKVEKNNSNNKEDEELASSVAPLKLGTSASMTMGRTSGLVGSGTMITGPSVEVKKRRAMPASQSMLDIGHQPRYDLYHR